MFWQLLIQCIKTTLSLQCYSWRLIHESKGIIAYVLNVFRRSPIHMSNEVFLKNSLPIFVVHEINLLLVHSKSKLVNYSTHCKSIESSRKRMKWKLLIDNLLLSKWIMIFISNMREQISLAKSMHTILLGSKPIYWNFLLFAET